MARARRGSTHSSASSVYKDRESVRHPSAQLKGHFGIDSSQELGSMYDYLAKIILIGPSGSGKSCLLHRIVKNQWRVLSSQTIGVEFSSKIIKVGTGSRRKRIKLQLWDTAGTERFRSVSRSYYRGAAGAILVYDVASHDSFDTLPNFLNDARALASPKLTCVLAGNKSDLATVSLPNGTASPHQAPSSSSGLVPQSPEASGKRAASSTSTTDDRLRSLQAATEAPEGREVTIEEASEWASKSSIPTSVEVSAYSGEGVDELFNRLAAMILTKIELGEIDPDDPMSGIQYGDNTGWDDEDSVKSAAPAINDNANGTYKGLGRKGSRSTTWGQGIREWESVFKFNGRRRQREKGCCS